MQYITGWILGYKAKKKGEPFDLTVFRTGHKNQKSVFDIQNPPVLYRSLVSFINDLARELHLQVVLRTPVEYNPE